MIAKIHRLTFFLFLGIVLLAPLPLASVLPWSSSLLASLVGAIMILEVLFAKDPPGLDRQFLKRMSPGLILWLGVALWAWLQSVPGLPDALAHPLWADVSNIIGRPANGTISLDPYETRTSLMGFLAFGGVFWISARYCRDPDTANLVLRIFVLVSGLYALYGLIVFFSGNETLLWFKKWAYKSDLTSTFVNRNSYATFAGLGFIAAFALTFDSVGKHLGSRLGDRAMTKAFIEWVLEKAWVPILAILLTGTALLLTHSRGGFLATSFGLLVLFGALFYMKSIPRKLGFFFAGLAVAGSIFVFTLSSDIVVKRLKDTTFETSLRDDLYGKVIEGIETNPWLGTGYGTFRQAFMAYKNPDLSEGNWDKAHNSYLELAMELGVPATAAIIGAFAWVGSICLLGLYRRRRRRIFSAVGLAATAQVVGHSLVDFSLQIPGFVACYALLMGMAWSQSWPSRNARR